jgi:hypothetical protein
LARFERRGIGTLVGLAREGAQRDTARVLGALRLAKPAARGCKAAAVEIATAAASSAAIIFEDGSDEKNAPLPPKEKQ